jgi:hypothetical protein
MTMDKNCKLQLCHIKSGPIPTSAKLRLVDEFNKASTYGVAPGYLNAPGAKLTMPVRLISAPLIITQAMRMIEFSVQHLALMVPVIVVLSAELQMLGSSRFMRADPNTVCTVVDEISITRDQYDLVHSELPRKKKIYSPFFNNYLQQCRREFEGYKTQFEKQPSVPAI